MLSKSTFIYDRFQSESSVGSLTGTDTTVKVENFSTSTDFSEFIIFNTNCDSILNKKHGHEIEINKYQPDIVVLTETFPKNIDSRNILPQELRLNGYGLLLSKVDINSRSVCIQIKIDCLFRNARHSMMSLLMNHNGVF